MKQKVYLPTAVQAILLPIVLIVSFCLANSTLLRQRFFSTESGEAVLEYGYMLGYKLDNQAVNGFGVFLFWLFIGAIGYIASALIVFVVHSYRSELTFKQYVSSMSAPAVERARHTERMRLLIRSGALAGIVAWIAGMVRYVLPLLQQNFRDLVLTNNILGGLLFLAIGSVALFVPVVLVRLFVLRVRVFGA